jgi:hypothetical protein
MASFFLIKMSWKEERSHILMQTVYMSTYKLGLGNFRSGKK